MSTRREFLTRTAAAGVVAAASVQGGGFSGKTPKVMSPAGARIKSVVRREETIARLKDSRGVSLHHGSFHMSWAADDRQYVTFHDGLGFRAQDLDVAYNNNLFAISGGPRDAVFHDVPSYPKLAAGGRSPWYHAWGTLALDKHIYQFVSGFNHPPIKVDGSPSPDVRFTGAKLIYSPDNGRTWRNQDGSTPVVWDSYEQRSPETMLFMAEPQGAFCHLSILQMGRNYEANRDGYIYVYGPNGNSQGTMNELVLFRVPKGKFLQRSAYEYFAGLRPNEQATWARDISARGVVHAFPRGWVATSPGIPFSWFPSVVYNAPLGVYLMANWGQAWTEGGNVWFGKPSYLGFWVAQNPWGPWTQIHEETQWLPAGDPNARAYQPQIVPKWIAPDGKSFWLAWDDFQVVDQEAERQFKAEYAKRTAPTPADGQRLAALRRRAQPYYGFNAQRVDLILA